MVCLCHVDKKGGYRKSLALSFMVLEKKHTAVQFVLKMNMLMFGENLMSLEGKTSMVFHLGGLPSEDSIIVYKMEGRMSAAKISVLSSSFQASSTSTPRCMPSSE